MGEGKVYIEIGSGRLKRFTLYRSCRTGALSDLTGRAGALTRTGELLDTRGAVRSWARIAGGRIILNEC
jgi:hypothetical protein